MGRGQASPAKGALHPAVEHSTKEVRFPPPLQAEAARYFSSVAASAPTSPEYTLRCTPSSVTVAATQATLPPPTTPSPEKGGGGMAKWVVASPPAYPTKLPLPPAPPLGKG